MPLYVKIDFRADGRLGAWWSRDVPTFLKDSTMNTTISETSIRKTLLALANEIDPEDLPAPAKTPEPTKGTK
jgi:hypothetical protein